MALTIDQIHAAADDIQSSGEKPTLSRVREALGGGSFSTISDAMQSWKARQREDHALSEINVPDALSERVEQLKAAAWQSAIEEAERRLSAERAALNESQAAASSAIAESSEVIDVLEAEALESEKKLETLRNQLSDAQTVATDAQAAQRAAEQQREANDARMSEKINGLEARLSDAVDARKNAEQRERDAAETNDQTSQQLEKMREQLQHAERCAASSEALKVEQAQALESEREKRIALESELHAERKNGQQQQQQHAEQMQSLSNELESARAAHIDIEKTSSVDIAQLRAQLSGLDARLSDAQSVIEKLTQWEKHTKHTADGSSAD